MPGSRLRLSGSSYRGVLHVIAPANVFTHYLRDWRGLHESRILPDQISPFIRSPMLAAKR